ncbi:MAG: DUF3891 family protein [Acidobacteriaceae bacterium]
MLIRFESALAVRPAADAADAIGAWELVSQAQQPDAGAGWLIPQPAHSALAGEIAAKLRTDFFPGLNQKVLRSISLHDAGWSAFDAGQIVSAREFAAQFHPVSFVAEKPEIYLAAWTDSIELAEKGCAECGYMVSRHFAALAKDANRQVTQFHDREIRRQQRLERASGKPHEELERLWHALRFCDLLSLFLCCNIGLSPGAEVRFGDYVMGREQDDFVFRGNSPMRERTEFTFSGVTFGGKSGGGWFNSVVR